MGPAIQTPELSEEAFITADGIRLPLRRHSPPEGKAPIATILALHGFNDYGAAFDMPAPDLTAAGLEIIAFDQRGFGEAGQRGIWPGHDTMREDAIALASALAEQHPGRPLFILGESMGGAVALLVAADTRAPALFAGAILSAPAVWGTDQMGIIQRTGLWLARRLFPGLRLQVWSERVIPSDNRAVMVALMNDPLVIKKTRVDATAGLVDLMGAAFDAGAQIRIPALVLYGEGETLIPLSVARDFTETLPAEKAQIRFYADGFHLLLRDRNAGEVIADIVRWSAGLTPHASPPAMAIPHHHQRHQGQECLIQAAPGR